tara:strand:+ start:2326 stop:4401 length:2076 start_codon:yes stop_codon:yes gene_type:complete
MKINHFFKAIIFIFFNSLFILQDTKSFVKENRFSKDRFDIQDTSLKSNSDNKNINFFTIKRINPLSIFLAFEEKQISPKEKNQLIIESNEQIDNKDYFIVKGDVSIKFGSAELKTDLLKFSKATNTISAEGNIQYQNNNQFIEADRFDYDLSNKSGSIINAYGIIDIVTLSEDLNWESTKVRKKKSNESKIIKTNFESENIIGLSIGQMTSDEEFFGSSKAELKINAIKKWRFQSPEILVNNELLSAKRASFTNDPFNPAQLTLESFNLKSKRIDGKLILISPWTTLNLDNKVKIPLARRTIKEDQENLQKWGIGFDYEDRDGFFLSRNSDSFELSNIRYQFVSEIYLQRIYKDKTNVFRKKDSSITSEKVENEINAGDYFGLKFFTNSNLLGYEFNTLTSLNSLNTERLSEATRFVGSLERKFNLRKIKNIENNIFLVYRNKIDTGFEGVKEIYTSIGTNFSKKYPFKINNLNFNSDYRLQLANFNSEELDSKNLVSHNRLSAVAFVENKYKIWDKKNPDDFINNTYKYTPLRINQGLEWVSKLTLNTSIYDNNKSQNTIKFAVGPELQLGKLKQKTFDYTKFRSALEIVGKSGNSPFKFDNVNESERIFLELKQQVYGPILLSAETHFNIDKNSNDYNKFINPKFSLSINRRAYSFEIYAVPDREISGFNFNVFGLGYEGIGKPFKNNF